jgi:hypothetical protein
MECGIETLGTALIGRRDASRGFSKGSGRVLEGWTAGVRCCWDVGLCILRISGWLLNHWLEIGGSVESVLVGAQYGLDYEVRLTDTWLW